MSMWKNNGQNSLNDPALAETMNMDPTQMWSFSKVFGELIL